MLCAVLQAVASGGEAVYALFLWAFTFDDSRIFPVRPPPLILGITVPV
jgi:hypothetical protein